MTALEMAPAPLYGELALHRLLVAIDGSANADLALTAAITAARRDHATITLILVGPDVWPGPQPGRCRSPAAPTRARSTPTDAGGCRPQWPAIPADVPVSTMYRRGKAGPEIIKAAKEGDYDAIVLGARGVGRVHALMGSVSQYVLNHAEIAVFVARPRRNS